MPSALESRGESPFKPHIPQVLRFPTTPDGLIDIDAVESAGHDLLEVDKRRAQILPEFIDAAFGLLTQPEYAATLLGSEDRVPLIRLQEYRASFYNHGDFGIVQEEIPYVTELSLTKGEIPYLTLDAHASFMIPPQTLHRVNLYQYKPTEPEFTDRLEDLLQATWFRIKRGVKTARNDFFATPPDFIVHPLVTQGDMRLYTAVLSSMDRDLWFYRFPRLPSNFDSHSETAIEEYLAILPSHHIELYRNTETGIPSVQTRISRALLPNDLILYSDLLLKPLTYQLTRKIHAEFGTGLMDLREDLTGDDWNFLVLTRTIRAMNQLKDGFREQESSSIA